MKIKEKSKLLALLLSLFMVATVVCLTVATCISVSAAKTITETVSILNPRQNMRGDGYVWMNIPEELTLTNLRIDTKDKYGLKICDGAVVFLKGNNYIKASEAAIYCGGTVTFKGTGTLTLESGGVGILMLNSDGTDTIRVMDGKIMIKATEAGIKATFAKIAIVGGEMDISVSSEDGFALDAYDTTINAGAKLTANNTVRGSYKLNLSDANVSIAAPKAALMYGEEKYFTLAKLELKVGSSADSLAVAEAYNGEFALSASSTVVPRTPSLLFGDEYTIALDIVLLVCGIILLAAVFVVPYLIRKKKTDKILAEIRAKEEAEMANKPKRSENKKKGK